MGDFQAHGLSYQGRNAPENVQLLKESEKKILREVSLLARCLMLN